MVLTMDTPQDLITLAEAVDEYGQDKLGSIGITYNKLRSWERRGLIRFWEQAGERKFVSRSQLEEIVRPKPVE